jgi:molybdate transport repressor ModE-like protein
VAREGSFRAAARSLSCSQSAVSQRIGQLERMVGDRLVDRQAGGGEVTVTDAGRLLLGHVDPILSVYRAARADVATLAEGRGQRLRVGVADHLVADALPVLAGRRNDVEVDIADGVPGAQLVAALRAGRLDVVVGDPPPRSAALWIARAGPEPYVLVAPASWAIVRPDEQPTEELFEELPLLRWDAGPQADRLDADLRARGIEPHYVAGATPVTLPWLVAAGAGAALVPQATAATWDAKLRTTRVDGVLAPREVAVSWHRDRRLSVRAEALAEAIVAVRAAGSPARPRYTERAA